MTGKEKKPSVAALFDFLMIEFSIISRADLADEMDISRSTFDNLLNGWKPLSGNQILHIHEYFGVAVWEIRERSGQHLPPQK